MNLSTTPNNLDEQISTAGKRKMFGFWVELSLKNLLGFMKSVWSQIAKRVTVRALMLLSPSIVYHSLLLSLLSSVFSEISSEI